MHSNFNDLSQTTQHIGLTFGYNQKLKACHYSQLY